MAGKKSKKSSRPAKHPDVLALVREGLSKERYRDTRHASDRKGERHITIVEIKEAVRAGYHEKAKDEFKPEHLAWNYSVRGKTLDDRELRVIVSFDEEECLLFVTAIDLTKD